MTLATYGIMKGSMIGDFETSPGTVARDLGGDLGGYSGYIVGSAPWG